MQRPTWIIASVASIATIAFASLVPALVGSVEFSVRISLQVITIIALIWTAAFTGESLWELRKARLVDFEPLLDVVLPRQLSPFSERRRVDLRIRNLGRGAATKVRVRLWQREGYDRDEWFSTLLAFSDDCLQKGDSISLETDIYHQDLWRAITARRLSKENQEKRTVDFVIEVTYRDALRRTNVLKVPFSEQQDPDTGNRTVTELPELECPQLTESDRQQVLEEYLNIYCEEDGSEGEESWSIDLSHSQFSIQVDTAGEPVTVFRPRQWPASRVAFEVAEYLRCLDES